MKYFTTGFWYNPTHVPPSQARFRRFSVVLLPLPPFFDSPSCLQAYPGRLKVTSEGSSLLNITTDLISRYFVCESACPLVSIMLNCMAPCIIETYGISHLIKQIFDVQMKNWSENDHLDEFNFVSSWTHISLLAVLN